MVVPGATGVTTPLEESTVATLVLLDVYVNAPLLVELGTDALNAVALASISENENVP